MLVHTMSAGSPAVQAAACDALLHLCADDEELLHEVSQEGAVEATIGMLRSSRHDELVTEAASNLLQHLCMVAENRRAVLAANGDGLLQQVMQEHISSNAIQVASCATLANLAVDGSGREGEAEEQWIRNCMTAVIRSMQGHKRDVKVQEEGIFALHNLLASRIDFAAHICRDLRGFDVVRAASQQHPLIRNLQDTQALLAVDEELPPLPPPPTGPAV